MAKKVTVVLAMRDNYTAVVKKARSYTSAFQKDVAKMTKQLDKASKDKRDMRIETSKAMKRLNALEKKLAPMRNVMVKVAAHIQHFKNQIKPVTDTFKKIATKAWTITLKVKDGASFVLTKINTALKKVGKGVVIGSAAVLAAGGYALNKGMALEGYNVSMGHFVGVNNPNASPAQVQKQTDDYLDALRRNANATPFGTEEVIQAGSRAVQIAEGNTDAAMGLVKMAENMAALTPGKTVMDAMEALADAQMGEFERMKEFGFKMSAEEFKKAGYDLFSTKGSSGKTLFEVYDGGAEKFKNTTTGMWSTITGEIESEIAEIGLELAKGLKPLLEWARDVVLPDLKQWLKPIKEGGQGGMETLTNGIKSLYNWLSVEIPKGIAIIQSVWDGLMATLSDKNSGISKFLGMFGVDLSSIFAPTPAPAPAATKPQYGDPSAGGLPKNSVFYEYAHNAGKQATGDTFDLTKAWDITKGGGSAYALYKTVQLLTSSKTLPAKILSTGVDLASTGVEAAGTAIGTASPTLGVALANLTSTLGSVLPGLPVMAGWMKDQQAISDFDFYQKNGRLPSGPVESFAYWNQFINDNMSKNADAWGDNVNTTMDNLFGIKRQPNGIFPDLRATWANWMKRNTENVAAGWMGAPAPGAQDPNAGLYDGGMYGDFDLTKRLADLQTTGVDAAVDSIKNTNTAATDASSALNTFASWLTTVRNNAGGGSTWGPPKAAGIKRVPWDNYPALLHKGETVLPSGEAGEYRSHGNQAGKAGNNISLTITVNGANMDENRLASILLGKLQEVALNTP